MDFNEARDDRVAVVSAGLYANHCTSLQADNHASTSLLTVFTERMLFPTTIQHVKALKANQMIVINGDRENK